MEIFGQASVRRFDLRRPCVDEIAEHQSSGRFGAKWTSTSSAIRKPLDLLDKHRDTTAFERASTRAWTQAQVQLRHIGIDPGEAGNFQRLAGHLLYLAPTLRPSSESILRGAGVQSLLWSLGISGDLPILLLRVSDTENLNIAHQLLQAHEYWRMKLLTVDLVILNERASSYVQDLQTAIETLVRTSQSRISPSNERAAGRVYLLRADLISVEARALLIAVSRVVLVGQRGPLSVNLIVDPISELIQCKLQNVSWESQAQCWTPCHRRRSLSFSTVSGAFQTMGANTR